jgi:micrococcal nuclease
MDPYSSDVRALRLLLLIFAALLLATPAFAGDDGAYDGWITLGGNRVEVHWDDGDSFTFLSGPRKGKPTRLIGFNTLESYGPVHRWGEWTAEEMWAVAKESPRFAASKTWECTTQGKKDAYKRLLVECPQLRVDMVGNGLAHVFAYDEPADPRLLKVQKEARIAERGIWAKGRPEEIVTSIHDKAGSAGFLRVVSGRTGETEVVGHRVEVSTCEEICHGDKWRGSCMVFVPYKRRYGDRKASCLEGEPPSLEAAMGTDPDED